MAIVLRRAGNNEKYFKPSIAAVRSMIRHGILQKYSKTHGYCDEVDNVGTGKFFWRNNLYKIEYMSGCFFPYLLQLNFYGNSVCTPSLDMFEDNKYWQENPEVFKQYTANKIAYRESRESDKYILVKDLTKTHKEPLMTLEEAKELEDAL